MEKEFIPYEQALELKKLGFDEPCFRWYDERWGDDLHQDKYNTNKDLFMTDLDCSAPLYQQAFRWFREKYQLYSWVKVEYEYGGVTPTYYITGRHQYDLPGGAFQTTEEAELACINKLIELVKNK